MLMYLSALLAQSWAVLLKLQIVPCMALAYILDAAIESPLQISDFNMHASGCQI
jgi:hypothetical protein